MDTTFYESIINRSQFLEGVYQNKKAQQEQIDKTVSKLKGDKDTLDKTEKVLKFLMDKLVKKDLSKMDALITYGLKSVYPDRDIRFRSELQERGKKIWIDLQTLSDNNLMDSKVKGSVHVIESFLLRLLCIIKLKRSRLMLMDETFSAVDNEYIENLSSLINELCKKLHMDVLLVTHNMGFLDYANHTYRILKKANTVEVVSTT
jgi:chromosome segregation ATPase